MNNTQRTFLDNLKNGFGEIAEDIMETAGFGVQKDGLAVPKGMIDLYPTSFSNAADKETVESMAGYYSRATADGIVAVKTLIDAEDNLLCAVVSRGIGGTSYFYERNERGQIEPVCSPITAIDLAMHLSGLHREHTLLSWGGLTADFRLLHRTGMAQEEWASLAANHIDMLYQLRMEIGGKINLQLACLSMRIVAVEEEARSFKIEEAIKHWKEGPNSKRTNILDSMRAYCKLLLALYGAVAERGEFLLKQRDSAMIEYAPNSYPIRWGRVWELYRNRWDAEIKHKTASNSESYVGVNIMHGWLEEHAERQKKTLQQLATPTKRLSDLVART